MKRVIKYFLLTSSWFFIHIILLLRRPTDCLEQLLIADSGSELFDIIGLLGYAILAFLMTIIAGALVNRTYNFSITRNRKRILICLVIVLAFSPATISYLKNEINGFPKEQKLRTEICSKIKPVKYLAYGTAAKNLQIEEYREIAELTGFPELPSSSINISYLYSYDGFLPDFVFELEYRVPFTVEVDTFSKENGGYSSSQTFEVKEGFKIVSYNESNS